MRGYDPQRPLIFIHVPKSAGSAVRGIVESWFPKRFYGHYYNEFAAKMPDRLDLGSVEFAAAPPVIYGHFNRLRGFGIEKYYPEVTQFATILRDPFETAVSHYFYVRKNGVDWVDQTRVPTDGLEDALKQVKPNILNHFPRQMNLTNYKDILEEMFIEIGVTERLSESLQNLARKLRKTFDPATLKTVNATERDEPVPEIYREQFMQAHPLEFAVYNFAKARFVKDSGPVD